MNKFACLECGAETGLGGKRGRRPSYCSNACKQRAYRRRRDTEKTPATMTALDRWTRADGKRPIQINGKPASSTDPTTWTTYALVRRSTAGDGYGVMLGSGLACIDLDDALDAEGNPTATAHRVLEAFPTSWVEISTSGRGLHLFGSGFEQTGLRLVATDGTGVEYYSRARFIRVTETVYRPGVLAVLDADRLALAVLPWL